MAGFKQLRSSNILPIIAWAALLAVQAFASEDGTTPATSGSESCLACHAEQGVGHIKFGDGTKRDVQVERKSWLKSVHGGKLGCVDCHREISGYPHPKVKFKEARDYTLARANTCQRCHYAHYTRVLDSIHYELQKEGMKEAPTCVDCHGSHAIQVPGVPRVAISNNCGKCHSDVNEIYRKSVHGKALIEGNNADVPVCTDCHGAHSISNPLNNPEFKAASYKMCAQCHGDAERMKKYGLSATVLKTYLDDFHGASNRLYAMGAGTPGKPIATCVDCHGVHDIESFHPGNPAEKVTKERVVKTCQKCHGDATPSFAGAWLSHYEPTADKAPLVWAVKWFYKIAIPLIMAGLVLHILLHLWRLKKHR